MLNVYLIIIYLKKNVSTKKKKRRHITIIRGFLFFFCSDNKRISIILQRVMLTYALKVHVK